MTLSRKINIMRMVGSASLCGAYLLITGGLLIPGVLLNTLGQLLLLPFGLRTRSWDLLALGGFFLTVNLRVLLGL